MNKGVRGYSLDTEMTFILERVHSISMYYSVIVFIVPNQYKSFRNEFIPVFIPNKILVLVRNFILVSCKLKSNFVSEWKLQIK